MITHRNSMTYELRDVKEWKNALGHIIWENINECCNLQVVRLVHSYFLHILDIAYSVQNVQRASN
jgi:hypothetical protein